MANINVVTQPHLGKLERVYKPENNMGGYLSLAKIITVHHKHNTADVQIMRTNNTVTSGSHNEGKFGARISVSTAHFNATNLTSSGVVEPIQEGQLVILAFLDGFKNQPVIIGSFHNTWETNHNVLTNMYPIHPDNSLSDKVESLKYLRVLPSQAYYKVDGIGGIEISHPSKSFLKVDADIHGVISDAHEGFDHSDLSEKDPITGLTRSGVTEDTSLPVKYLLAHRTSHDNISTTWTKIYMDHQGLTRFTRDNNDGKLFYHQVTPEGEYTIRRQLDSDEHGGGTNYTEVQVSEEGKYSITRNGPSVSSKFIMEPSGSIKITRSSDTVQSSIDIGNNGDISISNGSGGYITLTIQGDVSITCAPGRNINING